MLCYNTPIMTFFRYHSTNCFFIPCASGKVLAFDAGWPCTLYEYSRMMKTIGLHLEEMAGVIISHMHMDHAGLLGEFQHLGVPIFLTHEQVQGIDSMEHIILKNKEYESYKSIDKQTILQGDLKEINTFCQQLGAGGQVLSTPGHSPDSLSFLTDLGEALIGDLSPRDQLMPEDTLSWESWNLLERSGARMAYPSHAGIMTLTRDSEKRSLK